MLVGWRWLGALGLSLVVLGCRSSEEDSAGGAGAAAGTSASGGKGGGASGQAGEGGQGGPGGAGAAGEGGAAGSAGKEPGPPVQFRVATFNAENFFNDKKDSPGAFDEEVVSTAVYQKKLAGVAAILSRLNADLIMLEEVENDAVLAALQERPELGGRFTERALLPGNDPRGINVAALSTVPFTQVVDHKDDQFALAGTGGSVKYRFSRNLLELHAEINTRHVVFMGVHFKAKVDDDPVKRLAEAQRTRLLADRMREDDPEAKVIVLGDFNDFPGSDPLNAIEGQAPSDVFGSAGLLVPADPWTVKSSSAPGGLALHDDLRSAPWLQERIIKGSSLILHDEQLPAELRSTSDHAPVAVTYKID